MENQRTLLYITFFFLIFLLWQAWQRDYGPQSVPVAVEQPTGPSAKQVPIDIPVAEVDSEHDLPAAQSSLADRQTIQVVTDVFRLKIDTRGGDIRELFLRNYPKSSKEPDQLVQLLNEKASKFHVAQSGLISSRSTNSPAPAYNDVYRAEKTEYRLAEGDDSLQVKMTWQQGDILVDKIFTFKRDSYVIDVEHRVKAGSDWSGSQFRQLVRVESDERESKFIYTYTGGVVYNDELSYEKLSFDDMREKDLNIDMRGGWIAMIQHYFLAAWVPNQKEENLTYSLKRGENRFVLGMTSTPALTLKAGEQGSFHSQLVVGPKLQERLESVAPGLELTVDYGALTILAKPLFWLLNLFHTWFNNWGWAIIFLTLTIKLVFYKLSETSYRSMAKMRKVAPRLQTLKERYGDDRQRMSQAMMEMYKKEKINPLGGCLPILVQIPVFIALYWVLLESVEMRNAPFALWITNLSEKDPYYVLPLIMGVSMFLQYKLNPAPMDPMQQKLFQIMPVVFTIFFLWFPSGLVLYWVVNNILSITQQWVITRRIEASDTKT
jgi:YidC/Oxa1 family membrane protein insertase